eukprot:TRINITY_DN5052_c0_g1_i1.p1 TRINITY_DN5052_c0_g1~~TRINITY_DN5052_c0_g1_i1.p1  ORF type:complete len:553 (-),score=85.35 TRINITY_DN5052_c0_g1_i1:225-1883(-)
MISGQCASDELPPDCTSGTLDEITVWVVNYGNTQDMDTLLMTYRYFATPKQFFICLSNIYINIQPDQENVLSRFKKFLWKWIEDWGRLDFENDNRKMVRKVLEFSNTHMPKKDFNSLKLLFVKKMGAEFPRSMISRSVPRSRGSVLITEKIFTPPPTLPTSVSTAVLPTMSPMEQSSTNLGLGLGRSSMSPHPHDDGAKKKTATGTFWSGLFHKRSSSSNRSVPSSPLSPHYFFRSDKAASVTPNSLLKLDLKNVLEEDIAHQLTIIEADYFEKITTTEYLFYRGKSSSIGLGETLSATPTLDKISTRFNQVMLWVATEIVCANSHKRQLNLYKKFVVVAEKLFELNNFNTLMAIISGLNNPAVRKLKRLMNELPPQYQMSFEKLESLFDPSMNFHRYRSLEKKAPYLPYIPLCLKDLTFTHEGNSDISLEDSGDQKGVRRGPARINFSKMKMVTTIIQGMMVDNILRPSYKLQRNDVLIEQLKSVDPIEDSELYEYSLHHDNSGTPLKSSLSSTNLPSLFSFERRGYDKNKSIWSSSPSQNIIDNSKVVVG